MYTRVDSFCMCSFEGLETELVLVVYIGYLSYNLKTTNGSGCDHKKRIF